jgi:two-component system, OmpR family, sensor kinase
VRRFTTRTLRFRLTAWYCLALALGLVVFALVLLGLAEQHLLGNHDEAMTFKGHVAIHILDRQAKGPELAPDQVEALSRLGRVAITLEDQGKVWMVFRTPDLFAAPVLARDTGERDKQERNGKFSTVIESGDYWRIYTLYSPNRGGRVWKIRVLEELGDVDTALRKLRIAFFHLVPIGIVVTLIGGLVLSGKALKPVSNIIDLANQIEPTALSRRLPHPGVDDEIGRLVDTLNHMLTRIEASFEAMKRFTSDASHELRSPLATIRNTVDVTLEAPRSGQEQDAALRSIGEEVDRIRTLVEDLLLLAKADSGRMVMKMNPVSLAFILEAQVEAHQSQAQERNLQMEILSLLPDEVLGDERWLHQVAGNLLDNAIKYTPVGGTVSVDMARTEDGLQFSISDTGPGIPEEDLERVFERFFRVDPSRSRVHAPGLGLGLAIAAWVVGEHHGTLQASNHPKGGARFIVTLPLVQAQG